jgi:hypothetical protein
MTRLGHQLALMLGLILSFGSAPSRLTGQTASAVQRPTYWGTIALGQARFADSGMIHSTLGLSMQRGHLLLTGRVTGNQQGQKGDYRTRIRDAGILAGFATTRSAPLHFSVAAGLAAVHDIRDSSALGLPIEAQATWCFLPWAGLGLRVFAVPNKLANYGGIALALDAGRMRR